MRRGNLPVRLALILLFGVYGRAALAQLEAGVTPIESQARDFVRALAEDRFEDVPPLMDPTMNRVMPPATFRKLWADLRAQAGPFDDIARTRVEESGGFRIVHVDCAFENAPLTLRVVYNAAGLVSGFFIGPGTPAEAPIEPSYADRDAFEEVDTEVEAGDVSLPATLTIPKGEGPHPVAVFVHGSGPQDRDETVGANKVFRDLAWGLATLGIASLRYEKRTKAAPDSLDLASITYREETVDDALTALTMVARDERFDPDRVIVIGHSFGGTLAPLIARESDVVDGVVMMAATTEDLLDAVLRQTRYIFYQDEQLTEVERRQLQAIEDAEAQLETGGGQSSVLGGVTKLYIDALDAYDAPATARELNVPVFVAQGGRDYQVLAETSYSDWQSALAEKTNAKFELYDTLDHLFMPGEGPSYPRDYQRARNVSEEFVRDLAEWIEQLGD